MDKNKLLELRNILNQSVIISGMDSLGVPYTPDNYDQKSFLHFIKDQLLNLEIDIEVFDFHNMGRNKTWDFDDYFKKDYSKAELIDKHKRYFRVIEKNYRYPITNNFSDTYYIPKKGDENKYMKSSLVNSDKPIFIYSCGANDAAKLFGVEDLNILEMYKLIFEKINTFKQVALNIEENLISILQLNYNVNIYVLGGYTAFENKVVRQMLNPIYEAYNNEIKKICDKYPNIHFVNISNISNHIAKKDIHPTREGQIVMAESILDKIYESNKVLVKVR